MIWRRSALFGVLILGLAHFAIAEEKADISVRDAWIREMPPGMPMMAGYMTLQNRASRSLLLVAAKSPDFAAVMFHRTIVRDGMAHMEHEPQVEIAAKATLPFSPGGYHLMLSNAKRILRAGDRVEILLEFRGGLVVPVTFEVRK